MGLVTDGAAPTPTSAVNKSTNHCFVLLLTASTGETRDVWAGWRSAQQRTQGAMPPELMQRAAFFNTFGVDGSLTRAASAVRITVG